ncbi:hypothetical protein LTR08_005620 [Meristemomyces frigidus]|nr:hypothetical protein LTR08_005620 [Meristemomyces frigidus]
MKRHRDKDAGMPLRNKRLLTGTGGAVSTSPTPDANLSTGHDTCDEHTAHLSPPSDCTTEAKKPKVEFNDLPRELRDAIYSFTTQDTSSAVHRGRRDPEYFASNTWEIGYVNGPILALLLVSKAVNKEYLELVAKTMYVVVWLEMREASILGEAKWYEDLPEWVREAVRGVRVVLGLAMAYESWQSRVNVQDIPLCVQNTVNTAAASLPNLSSLEIFLVYHTPFQMRLEEMRLEDHIKHSGLDVARISGVKPMTAHIDHCSVGLLVEWPLRSYPGRDTVYGQQNAHAIELAEDMENAEEHEAQYGKWYATACKPGSKFEYLGMHWHFLTTLADENDDDGDYYADLSGLSDDGSSCISAVTDRSDETWSLDEADWDFVAQLPQQSSWRNSRSAHEMFPAHHHTWPSGIRVNQEWNTMVGFMTADIRHVTADEGMARCKWINSRGELMADYKPSVEDWRVVGNTGFDLEEALLQLEYDGQSTETLQLLMDERS